MHAYCPWRSAEAIRYPGTGITDVSDHGSAAPATLTNQCVNNNKGGSSFENISISNIIYILPPGSKRKET